MAITERPPATEAAIFVGLWDRPTSKLTPTVARYILRLRFSDEQRQHVVDLVRRSQTGGLTAGEVTEMDNLLKVGDLLALLQSKARQVLKRQAARRNGHG
jgi:hypothetical protein